MEQEFSLLYMIPGITDVGLEDRTRLERVWMVNRLAKEKKREADDMEKASKGVKKPKKKRAKKK